MSGEPPKDPPSDRDTPGDDLSSADDPTASPGGSEATRRRMVAAIRGIRREGLKVAAVSGAIDAALVALIGNLLVRVLNPPYVPASVALPQPLRAGLAPLPGRAPRTVAGAAVVAVGLGVVAFVLEVAVRSRRPVVEQFEAANPEVAEALRTARDAVEEGATSRMALRLYEDVLDRLRATSSLGLLDSRRVAATALLIAVVSLASVHVAVAGLDLGTIGRDAGPDGADRDPATDPTAPTDDYDGLQNGSDVLGDPEDVDPGDRDVNATIPGSDGGHGDRTDDPGSYDDGGFSGDPGIQRQEAGFLADERVEDADLIREYNLRIREENDE